MLKAPQAILHFLEVLPSLGRHFQHPCILMLLCLLQPIGLFAQNQTIRVEASFSPASVSIGKNSIYKVVIFGSQALPEGKMPSIPGLTISNSPQMFRSASLINGIPSVTMELSFQARPTKQGSLTLPSWIINAGGNSVRVPPATLRVLSPNQQDELLKDKENQQQKRVLESDEVHVFVERLLQLEIVVEVHPEDGEDRDHVWWAWI